jgi:hypothetical protein
MALIYKKKTPFPIEENLRKYLNKYHRERTLPLKFSDLKRFINRIPLLDKKGNDTLWESVSYSQSEMPEIYEALKVIYADLKTDGDASVIKHLVVDRVDVCTYANTNPFRIRIINKVNDNSDYFYIKNADASRVIGLELEHLLSPNVLSYMTDGGTLVEEHIAGIPGDIFMENHLNDINLNPISLAKEFIKFNERCFVRLLGDMHSSNFVVIITPDFEDFHYRIRAIDFDQQSYEGSKSVYMPQYFKQNNAIIELGMKYMTPESVRQYQIEERTLIAHRYLSEKRRLDDLMLAMRTSKISPVQNLNQLKKELAHHYKNNTFLKAENMGAILHESLRIIVDYKRQEF